MPMPTISKITRPAVLAAGSVLPFPIEPEPA